MPLTAPYCALDGKSCTQASPRGSKSGSQSIPSKKYRRENTLLAHHWFRAEEWEKALSYTRKAAETAQNLGAYPEAVSHYWQAVDLVQRLPKRWKRVLFTSTSSFRYFPCLV